MDQQAHVNASKLMLDGLNTCIVLNTATPPVDKPKPKPKPPADSPKAEGSSAGAAIGGIALLLIGLAAAAFPAIQGMVPGLR